MRGNVVDLAVAVVVGGAFGTIVNALVKDLVTPLIAAVVGKPDFSALSFQINSSKFLYGDFLNAVVSFLLIASVIYFLVVVPMNSLSARFTPKTEDAPLPLLRECPECLSEIPAQARRCKYCTAVVGG